MVFFLVAPALGGENPLAYKALVTANDPPLTDRTPDLLGRILLYPLSFYSRILSPLDGQQCPLSPSCAQYASQALHRHGGVVGFWLTVDRLIHERTQVFIGKRRSMKDGQVCVLDPLSDNDFWF